MNLTFVYVFGAHVFQKIIPYPWFFHNFPNESLGAKKEKVNNFTGLEPLFLYTKVPVM